MTQSKPSMYVGWKNWAEKDFGKPSDDERTYCEEEIAPYLKEENARVLEIGFGNGSVIGWCRERGCFCVGVETNTLLVDRANETGIKAVKSLTDVYKLYGSSFFDVILAFDVLEHIPSIELNDVFNEVCGLLKPEAVFIARFPNGDSPFGRAYQYGDTTHLTVLGSVSIQMLAMQTGFILESIKAPSVPFWGSGFLRGVKRLLLEGLRMAIDFIISQLYFAGVLRVFSASLVVILRKSHTQ